MFLQSAKIVSAAGGLLLRLMDEEQLQHQDSNLAYKQSLSLVFFFVILQMHLDDSVSVCLRDGNEQVCLAAVSVKSNQRGRRREG